MPGRTARKRNRRYRWLGLLLLPPIFWGAVLLLIPTEHLRLIIEEKLEAATGCPASVDAVWIGPLGGIKVQGVSLWDSDAEGVAAGSWVSAERVEIDLSLGELFIGHAVPGRVSLRGLDLRLVRREGESLPPLFFLKQSSTTDVPRKLELTATADDMADSKDRVRFMIEEGRIAIIDEQSTTAIVVQELQGLGAVEEGTILIDRLEGALESGGQFALSAAIERGDAPSFSGHLNLDKVHLTNELGLLRYLLPFLPGAEHSVDGRLDLELELAGGGPTSGSFWDTVTGRGTLKVDPIRLDGSSLLNDLARVLPLTGYGKIGTLRSAFKIEDRAILSSALRLELGGTAIVLRGGALFDGRMRYQLDQEWMGRQFDPQAVALLAELGLSPDDLLRLEITGTFTDPVIRVGGLPLDDGREPQSRIQSLTQRLQQRFLR